MAGESVETMQNVTLIYVAGNPELYPLEYYDAETGTYQGAIPALLADFADRSGYEIVYYEPGATDRRAGLAEHVQVDVISGITEGEHFAGAEDAVVLFAADVEGERIEYSLAFTGAAPEIFQQELTGFVQARSDAAQVGEILTAALDTPPSGANMLPVCIGLGAALCAALAALLAAVVRGRRYRRALETERELDGDTGLLSAAGFEKAFYQMVNAQNRVLYFVACFHFEINHIERLRGPGQLAQFYRRTADVLRGCAKERDILARWDGGDFLVLYERKDTAEARKWALAVLERLKEDCAGVALNDRDAAVGIFPMAASDQKLDDVLYHARQCAFAAQGAETGIKVCQREDCLACEEERELLNDLERGLEYGEFQLYLQFFVSADDFSVTGGEALSRWQHPGKGLLMPDRFIPLFEREGRIEQLDFYNLDKACGFLQRLEEKGKRGFYLSCNFSRRSFAQPGTVERCREIVQRYCFPHSELIIEITESGLIQAEEAEMMRRNILAVRELGLQVMFDDFGMGYTAFGDLREYPMDGLKLDKSLIDNMGTEQGKVILKGIVRTGHGLGLTVLAEGIEEAWQVDALKELHCDLLQGYLFSMPIPEAEALRRLTEMS